jgi:broad specificity phosphatase PhoE
LEVDERFTDLDYGRWAGRTLDQLSPAERTEFRRWQRQPDVPLPGAEDPRAAQRRACDALVERAASAGCVAIVTHDAILQLLLCRVLGIAMQAYRGIAQHTATLNEVRFHGDGWKVYLLNSTWHLDTAD